MHAVKYPIHARAEQARSRFAPGFDSVPREIFFSKVAVKGEVPEWLSGSLIRSGPAKFEVEGERYRHWFDGLAMLHAFSFCGGTITYRNRFLESEAFAEAHRHKRITRNEFATDPCRTAFGRMMSIFSPQASDNGNVNVWKHADRLFAVAEAPLRVEIDQRTLAGRGSRGYEDAVVGQLTTAHPHFDRNTGALINYVTAFGERCGYTVFAMESGEDRRTPIAFVPAEQPSYMHSFAMTEKYVVLVEFPHVVSPIRMKFRDRPFIESYRWSPHRATRFTVIDKSDGRVVNTCESEPFFAFHHVNAFEDGDSLAIDLVAYPDASILERLYLDRLRTADYVHAVGSLERYRVPVARSRTSVEREPLSAVELELPRIDYAERSGRTYRYVYGTGSHIAGNFLDSLVKIDAREGGAWTWFEEGCYPGEPVFVRDPGAAETDEDRGVVLSVVLDARTERSFLLVLDAETFSERARAIVPQIIPFGFHGEFFESGALSP